MDALLCSDEEMKDSHATPGFPSASTNAQDNNGGIRAGGRDRDEHKANPEQIVSGWEVHPLP